ncbi:hypothetical protein HG530_005585 [Fusarium avenaceum]|nr:hypothetical protein HG530_005585 [Fusarium avenaceum]
MPTPRLRMRAPSGQPLLVPSRSLEQQTLGYDADPLQREVLPEDSTLAIGDLGVKDEEISDSQDGDDDEDPQWAPSPSPPIKSEDQGLDDQGENESHPWAPPHRRIKSED